MALIDKVYYAILLQFKEEIFRNPDADPTPSIRKFSDELRKQEKFPAGNQRGLGGINEGGEVAGNINTLLSGMYGEDIQPLRRAVAKVMLNKGADTIKLEPSQRKALFQCLCEALSLRTQEDFSDIIAMCDWIEGTSSYEKLLSDFKDEVCCNPDADYAPYIQKIKDKCTELINKLGKDVVNILLRELYGEDIQSLRGDIAEVMAHGTTKDALSKRSALFQCLCKAFSLYAKEDFSKINLNGSPVTVS